MLESRINKSCMITKSIKQINQSISHICGAPTKALFILPESILITPLFGITKFDSLLISKHFKKQRKYEQLLARNKGGSKALLKNVILEPKENALRVKKKMERRQRRILDVIHLEKVERRRIESRM